MWMTKAIRPHRANKLLTKRRHPTSVFTNTCDQADERDLRFFLKESRVESFCIAYVDCENGELGCPALPCYL